MFGLASLVVAGTSNTVLGLKADLGVGVTTPGVDVPDARICETNTGCNQVDTPDVDEEEIREDISVEIGDLDGN
ncbi:MAG: hypothetical protein M3162_09085 [Thermoproteota archaeon]|nr:hypothetical protein [Thermoproteota archaeon]